MIEAVIYIGIQATGKSTFYKEKFFGTHIRINLDMLKTRHREKLLFETCLRMKQSFVIDNTNPTRSDRNRYICPAKESGLHITGYYFRSDISSALRRNSIRYGNERIPEKGIKGTYSRLELPSYDEGFDKLYYVAADAGQKFKVTKWTGE
ncbi:kinase [Desulfonema ishimotonii]|uniref:Kinase n=1 Tax=Desulfonema ishimotonii TaxID=45657 RepID=A0A401G220_9BACT|nr:AAA family ATPase [Desulfonema ishimotonii]GBC63233.1 kinase [Desulfonema ishimotonii]